MTVKPNPKRQVLYAAIMLASVMVGYYAAPMLAGKEEEETEVAAKATEPPAPWYQGQPDPPSFITEPDAPLLPETGVEDHDALAYEEALPDDTYMSPPPKRPLRRVVVIDPNARHLPPSAMPKPAPKPAAEPAPASPPASITDLIETLEENKPAPDDVAAQETPPAPVEETTPEPAPPVQASPESAPVEAPPETPAAQEPQPQADPVQEAIEIASLPPQEPPSAAPPAPEPEVLAPSGPPAWMRNAMPAPKTGGRPMIAVVIDDMGIDRKRSERIVSLPGVLTTAYLSYANDLAGQAARARAAGREVILHVPMEPKSANVDPGPDVLLTRHSEAEIRTRLAAALDRFDGFAGINNHMGSKFTAHAEGMGVVLDELAARGLLFLDSRTAGSTVGSAIAREIGVPTAERNVFLDNVNEVGAVMARLAETERVARRQGFAVAIGHPRDATVAALAKWMGDAARRGFVLVPLSAVVDHSPLMAELMVE